MASYILDTINFLHHGQEIDYLFSNAFEKRFRKNLNFFFKINMFLMFSNHFDILISKIIFKK